MVIESFDAGRLISVFRDHLSRHDRPVGFLFGAGTSAAVRIAVGGATEPIIPTIVRMTECCREKVATSNEFAAAWDGLAKDCVEDKQGDSVEAILSRVRGAAAAVGSHGTLHGLGRSGLQTVELRIRQEIGRLANPDLAILPAVTPHDRFARWIARTSRAAPVEIFSLNYDVLVENALERAHVPVFDGFVGIYEPFFHSESLRRVDLSPGSGWSRLWKIHGSVSWSRKTEPGGGRVIRTSPTSSGEMILPSVSKYDQSRQQPFLAYLDRLTRFLEQDDALLICCGYSFGDQHVNNVLFTALDNRRRAHVVSLCFENVDNKSDLHIRAKAFPNLMVVGPNHGIVNAREVKWQGDEQRCKDEGIPTNVIDFPAGAPDKDVIVKLGDFGIFSQFLESISG